MTLPSPTCVIRPGLHRYHVEVREVRYSDANHRRWWKANPCPKPHYEAVVTRGGVRRADGGWKLRGDECCGPGWEDVFGRTRQEAVSKARVIAREWVRWQLSLVVVIALLTGACSEPCRDTIHTYPAYHFSCPAGTDLLVEPAAPESKQFHVRCRCPRNVDGGAP